MSYQDEWKGSQSELSELLEEIMDNFRLHEGILLDDKEMRKLLCETLSRRDVSFLMRQTACELYHQK